MRRTGRRWWFWPRRIAIVIAAPIVVALFIVALPILLPFAALAQLRSDRRKRAVVEVWSCGWCTAPLGAEALTRADLLFAAYAETAFGDDGFSYRIARRLDACCPRCDAGHRFDGGKRFELLHGREFAAMYGDLVNTAVPPATATLAWPWVPVRTAAHEIVLTRDGVCMGDDIDAPQSGTITVPGEADVAAIGEALLRSPWLAFVGTTATWRCETGATTVLIFGKRAGVPFVERLGREFVRADTVKAAYVRSERQGGSDQIAGSLSQGDVS